MVEEDNTDMRKLTLLLLATVLVWPLGMSSAQNQRDVDTLLINYNGDFWRTAEQAATEFVDLVDGCSGNVAPDIAPLVMSPTGRYVAYEGYAPGMRAVIEAGWGGPIPTELWVCDLQTFTETRIYAQPEGFNIGTANDAPIVAEIISTPAWSPDGNRLAFTTLSSTDDVPRLLLYDMQAAQGGVINDSLARGAGAPRPPDVQWGTTGIVALSNVFANNTATYQLDVYDDAGNVLDSQIIPNIDSDGAPVEHLIAQRGAEEIVVLPHVSGSIDYYNLTARVFEPATGVIQFSVVDSGIRLLYLPNLGAQGATWEAEFPNGSLVLLPHSALASMGGISISPTGQSIALYNSAVGSVEVWQNGALVGNVPLIGDGSPLPSTTRIVWGAGRWSIVDGGFGG